MALSPMMQQYTEIKKEYQDSILFYRVGDFYEMFFHDAITASKELELTLTGKNCGLEERAPMCGVPFHSADSYIAKLIDKGYKVAICEQVEDPAITKSLVKREVIQVITPGTVMGGNMLEEKENNYIASIYYDKKGIGLCYCDISTGEVNTTEFSGQAMKEILNNELVRIHPKEIIINESASSHIELEDVKEMEEAYFTALDQRYYSKTAVRRIIEKQWEIIGLTGIGLEDREYATMALGAQLLYFLDMQKQSPSHLKVPNVYQIGNYMSLDKSTIRNLEITETLMDKKTEGSLLWVLDKTHTAMGSRKMKKWLREPLNNGEAIKERLNSVEVFVEDPITRNNLKEHLKAIYDFERLSARIACGNCNARDLVALCRSLYVLPDIKMDLENSSSTLLSRLSEQINTLTEVFDRIHRAIAEDPPFTVREGGLIKEGYSKELDEMKNSVKDAKDWIARLEEKERKRTGIGNIKVGYNKVFGYYIEITQSNYDKIPDNYIRKQTLTNAERFITPELKETEGIVLNAETKIDEKEYQLFTEIRKYVATFISQIQQTSEAISTIDVLVSFGEVSSKMGYIKPEVNDGSEIIIEKGRHPVIEQTIEDGIFVSNDTYINGNDSSLLLITGPNMSGKSTYMRQTALIVLMAQAGCFVPCNRASIGIADRIFTRIGSADNLAEGQSTFFVEMSELAYILTTATTKSLVILDEIGRGTSTYDGLSIAFAVSEYLCREDQKIRTLFASHYHELTELEGQLKGLKNLNVDVSEENGDIVFLHKIVQGPASRSYGIHVAKLAGIPKSVLERAEEKLKELEEKGKESPGEEGQQLMFHF